MAAEFTGSLVAEAGKDSPLDALFNRLMHDPRVNVHLIAMPKPHPGTTNPGPRTPKREFDQVGGKGGNPKRPRPNDKEPAQIPDELKGLKLKTADGKPMCWHFNLAKSCNNPVKNGRCKFGFHSCMKCGKPKHGAASCHSGAS
eukprot:s6033_g2.t1